MKVCLDCHTAYSNNALCFCPKDGSVLLDYEQMNVSQPPDKQRPADNSAASEKRLINVSIPPVVPPVQPAVQPIQSTPIQSSAASAPPEQSGGKQRAKSSLLLPLGVIGVIILISLAAVSGAMWLFAPTFNQSVSSGDNSNKVSSSSSNENITANSAKRESELSSLSTGVNEDSSINPAPTVDNPAPNVGGSALNANIKITPKASPQPSGAVNVNQNASRAARSEEANKISPPPTLAAPTNRPNGSPSPSPIQRKTIITAGGVVNGKATSLPKPAYPPGARDARAAGQVLVQVLIGENGSVESARAVSGNPVLRAAAEAAARQARFQQTTSAGQPVKVTGVIIYNFAPNQ